MAIDIDADLQKIHMENQKEGVTITPGKAYYGHSKGIQIFHSTENTYALDVYVQEFQVHESIHRPGVTGFLKMLDTYNLVRNGIILGQELLYLKFSTAGAMEAGIENTWSVDYTKHPFQIYRIEKLESPKTGVAGTSESALSYILHFCSPELLQNDRIKISQTMQGTVSDIVNDILENNLGTTKTLEVVPTEDLKQYIIPNFHPFDAISRITPIAQSTAKDTEYAGPPGRTIVPQVFKGRLTDYYFWETTRGYKFLPMIRPKTSGDFTLSAGRAVTSESYPRMMSQSLNYSHLNHINTYHTIKAGAWGGKHIQHNAFSKSVKTYQSNYLNSLQYYRYSHVSKTPVYNAANGVEPQMISEFPNSTTKLSSFGGSQKYTNILKTPAVGGENFNSPWSPTPSDTSLKREMQTLHSTIYDQLSLTINGISALEAGMTVKLNLPDIGRGSGYFDQNPAWENRFDNIWIITEVKHILNPVANTYFCELKLSNTMRATGKDLPVYDSVGDPTKKSSYKKTDIYSSGGSSTGSMNVS